ncbi:MAG: hypothetical protein NC097_04815 [Clostridium sp.]|nr:hypothetical protein [Prevotella sp.]MCM1429099.1 hypothetical protein [Clostridium sp.]MCM1475372.1 hypothetical protein [Muribaculaceae bacterium]
MKKKGNVCDFSEERNRQLRKVYRKMLADTRLRSAKAIFAAMAVQPAPRFFVNESRALTVIRHRQRTGEFPILVGSRLSMYEEIWRRFVSVRGINKVDSDYDLIFDIVNSPAPSFYLTPGSIRTILSRA